MANGKDFLFEYNMGTFAGMSYTFMGPVGYPHKGPVNVGWSRARDNNFLFEYNLETFVGDVAHFYIRLVDYPHKGSVTDAWSRTFLRYKKT